MQDPINGHEYSNTDGSNPVGQGSNLQFACIFPLTTPYNCTAGDPQCDCDPSLTYAAGNAFDSNPLCQQPNGTYSANQGYAKGYPGLRELDVLKKYSDTSATVDKSIVASICPRNLTDNTRPDYGYRPAVSAIIDRLAVALGPQCLPRALIVDPTTGAAPCSVIEANPAAGATCVAAQGRTAVTDSQVTATVYQRLRSEGVCDSGAATPACSTFKLCTIDQVLPGTPTADICYNQPTVPAGTTPGWCYTTNQAVTGGCPRTLRFMDPSNNTPVSGSRALIACFGAGFGGDGG